MTDHAPLSVDRLRWRCDPSRLPFETTDEVDASPGIVGQPTALDALSFGLESKAPGQNVFVRGLTGTGRMTMVGRLLEQLKPDATRRRDRAYVHNFVDRDRPRLLTLPPGTGRELKRRMVELARFVETDLQEALESDVVKARVAPLEEEQRAALTALAEPFEKELAEADLALVSMQMGSVVQMAIFPRVDGKPVQPEELEQRYAKGEIAEEAHAAWRAGRDRFAPRLAELSAEFARIRRDGTEQVRAVVQETARAAVAEVASRILEECPGDGVERFLDEVVDDVVENRLGPVPEGQPKPDLDLMYGVNVILCHENGGEPPVVVEHTPNLPNLLGSVDREWGSRGPARSNYSMIRAGSLLRADGGYLVVDARDVLGEPGAWKLLVRTLRSSLLEIVPSDLAGVFGQPTITPEPIRIQVRVVMLGDARIYYLLDGGDPDFAHLFKVLADFDSEIEREPDGVQQYGAVLARIAKEEDLPPFHRTAVAALAEHGARVAAREGKLTARFARIADIAREAAFLAAKEDARPVTGEHVVRAVRRTRERASLPSRRFQELLKKGTIHVGTRGEEIGQINGLAVISAGPLTYGFPARITASLGPGSAGIINIEGHANLSGSIHTKGFHILGGLLRHLLRTEHPLMFSASLAFEQSYGGIDGDSASGAEICCLLSALADVPLRQDLAITGAIDQRGRLQAIGGVNEKIEGFFDTCRGAGLTGTQGVIVPNANAGDLMLRAEVVEACAEGQFRVYAVDTVMEALEILTGLEFGEVDENGECDEDSLLGLARDRVAEFWVMTSRSPAYLLEQAEAEEAKASEETEEPAPPIPAEADDPES